MVTPHSCTQTKQTCKKRGKPFRCTSNGPKCLKFRARDLFDVKSHISTNHFEWKSSCDKKFLRRKELVHHLQQGNTDLSRCGCTLGDLEVIDQKFDAVVRKLSLKLVLEADAAHYTDKRVSAPSNDSLPLGTDAHQYKYKRRSDASVELFERTSRGGELFSPKRRKAPTNTFPSTVSNASSMSACAQLLTTFQEHSALDGDPYTPDQHSDRGPWWSRVFSRREAILPYFNENEAFCIGIDRSRDVSKPRWGPPSLLGSPIKSQLPIRSKDTSQTKCLSSLCGSELTTALAGASNKDYSSVSSNGSGVGVISFSLGNEKAAGKPSDGRATSIVDGASSSHRAELAHSNRTTPIGQDPITEGDKDLRSDVSMDSNNPGDQHADEQLALTPNVKPSHGSEDKEDQKKSKARSIDDRLRSLRSKLGSFSLKRQSKTTDQKCANGARKVEEDAIEKCRENKPIYERQTLVSPQTQVPASPHPPEPASTSLSTPASGASHTSASAKLRSSIPHHAPLSGVSFLESHNQIFEVTGAVQSTLQKKLAQLESQNIDERTKSHKRAKLLSIASKLLAAFEEQL